MVYTLTGWLLLVVGIVLTQLAESAEFDLNGQRFTLPDGFQIELVAGQPLIQRPVNADFDERGRLYVTDSSGSNESLEVQRQQPADRIVRLVDDDGDGVFNSSTVYADKLTFPEGALWFDGSLYVAAPPEIWKFTDGDDDGVAEHREVWFDGKTLTHCGNDLHGPYLGPDGWFYWCKGAFAEQTVERYGRSPMTTKAAHIFRRHPSGGPVESVMTGGMDNPVEIAFTPGGERIFTTTFLVHPSGGNRDGLIHAAYGGVYGKEHNVLNGHPRTGNLMPVLAHLGVAAPCGLARLESAALGDEFKDNLLATSFNMHKITRHELTNHGATFRSNATDLLVSDNLDFHPTDVLEDADGSLLVVDTGGWFRLCCPTSQLQKPDVLGGIYRIRKTDATQPSDPRGQQIDWEHQSAVELVQRLADSRFAVRNQARRRIAKRGSQMIDRLSGTLLSNSTEPDHRLQAVWALTAIDDPQARVAVRAALTDSDETVRQAALHSISLHRDTPAREQLVSMLNIESPHNRRAAAEALGRIGNANAIPPLLSVVPLATLADGESKATVDRFLEHSLIYAVMELSDPVAVRQSLASEHDTFRRAALIALDQMEGGSHLQPSDIAPLLVSQSDLLNETAWWIAQQHPDWGDIVATALQQNLRSPPRQAQNVQRLADRLKRFSGSQVVQQLMAETLRSTDTNGELRLALIEAMSQSGQKPMPDSWQTALCGAAGGRKSSCTIGTQRF